VQWQCGDSFFTKYSSCSFDRAAHDPNNLLNPLHPSITPFGQDKTGPQSKPCTARSMQASQQPSKDGLIRAKANRKPQPVLCRPSLSTIEDPSDNADRARNNTKTMTGGDVKTGEVTAALPLSEVGKASRFGDKTLGERSKCNVFEVVLQSKERAMCPACARSPKRAGLPARKYFRSSMFERCADLILLPDARGCFGLS
jgi:hypothetical protein